MNLTVKYLPHVATTLKNVESKIDPCSSVQFPKHDNPNSSLSAGAVSDANKPDSKRKKSNYDTFNTIANLQFFVKH